MKTYNIGTKLVLSVALFAMVQFIGVRDKPRHRGLNSEVEVPHVQSKLQQQCPGPIRLLRQRSDQKWWQQQRDNSGAGKTHQIRRRILDDRALQVVFALHK